MALSRPSGHVYGIQFRLLKFATLLTILGFTVVETSLHLLYIQFWYI